MTIFWLIRHGAYGLLGQALGGRGDHALSAEGRAEAARLAAWLAGSGIETIVTSPVRRAAETAAVLGGALGLAVVEDADFSEIDFGIWTGRRFDELAGDPDWHAWNACRAHARAPGGETMLEAQLRSVRGLWRLAGSAARIAVVTHADIIRAILLHVLGAPLDSYHRLDIAPASVSQVGMEGVAARVLGVNLVYESCRL